MEHGPEGALGVIVEQADRDVHLTVPQVPILEGQPHVPFRRPLQTNQVMMLYRINDTENSHHLVSMASVSAAIWNHGTDSVGRNRTESFRAYLGYWDGDRASLRRRARWFVVTLPADPSIVFDPDPDPHLARNLPGPRGTFPALRGHAVSIRPATRIRA